MNAKVDGEPPPFDEIVRRMLNTPPTPHVSKRKTKAKKKAAKKPAK